MPTNPIRAVLEALSREGRAGGSGMNSSTSFIMDLLYFGGFSIFEQVSSGDTTERVNLIGYKGPPTGEPLLLVTTLATSAPPVPATWSLLYGEPGAPRLVKGAHQLVGPGAQSGKVDAVLKILAGSRFRSEDFKRPLIFVGLSGGEGAASGARPLLDTLPAGGGLALLYAPTALALWTDHPGGLALRLELTRRVRHRRMPPHAGFFELTALSESRHALAPDAPAADALAKLLETLEFIRTHTESRVLSLDAGEASNRTAGRASLIIATSSPTLPDLPVSLRGCVTAAPIPDGTTLPFPVDDLLGAWQSAFSAGMAAITPHLGLTRNAPQARPPRDHALGRLASTRDTLTGSFMVWTGPGVDHHDLCERFADAAQRALTGHLELELQLDILHDRPAFAGSEGNERLATAFRAAAHSTRLPATTCGGLATTDAALFRAHGYETLAFGASGPLSALYTDNEAVATADLEQAINVYEHLIEAHCLR